MYVLMAWGRLKAESWRQFEKHYADKVKPMTQAMKGLQERQLWLGKWDSLDELRNYEVSEARRDLAQEVEQYYQPWA